MPEYTVIAEVSNTLRSVLNTAITAGSKPSIFVMSAAVATSAREQTLKTMLDHGGRVFDAMHGNAQAEDLFCFLSIKNGERHRQCRRDQQ